jgi:hypothetical protein
MGLRHQQLSPCMRHWAISGACDSHIDCDTTHAVMAGHCRRSLCVQDCLEPKNKVHCVRMSQRIMQWVTYDLANHRYQPCTFTMPHHTTPHQDGVPCC